ncbi:MAG: phosphoadenosine phosphosulfate reductase [Armatimonadota bacterium]|nr:MAG: phosphoadenosine phosphosulfate reductase [Armatimonadota bacterium]
MVSAQTLDVQQLNAQYEILPPQALLQWAVEQFGNRVALACSFGAEDVVLVDMLVKITPQPRIFVLDTGRLHQETYDVMERCRQRYRIEFEVYFPQTALVEQLLRTKGANSFYLSVENRKECCHIRKVEPLGRALQGLQAWITGLRRQQAVTRAGLPKIEVDDAHGGILKLNPLVDWSEQQVWDYIHTHNVPYNVLHDRGFPSIGCAPCTRAIQPGEDIRAGRWWWETPEQKECGLHVKPK